jgi:threonine dehydratase
MPFMRTDIQESIPGAADIRSTHNRILPFIHRTPVLTSATLDRMTGARLFFKCENLQKIGAFKIRGATNVVKSLHPDQLAPGLCTHSSGNHAQAVAYAARAAGVPAYIVMPSNSPDVKKRAVEGYGAEITYCEPNQAAREAAAQAILDRTGAHFIHPYDDYRIIAGQGTAAKELLEDTARMDILLAPVGGGGLLAGTALAAKHFSMGVQVIGCEPAGADDAFRSFRDRVRYPSQNPQTIADGLLTGLGERNYGIIIQHVHDIVTCSEEAIVAALRLIWERMKIVIEPSSAVPLACILEGKINVTDKNVGILLSGGNVDLGKLPF